MDKQGIKKILGEIPFFAEAYWLLRQTGKPPVGGYSLEKLSKALDGWVEQAEQSQSQSAEPKRIMVFSMLRYWLEYSTLLSLALFARGHHVTLAYLPYAHWKKRVNRFDSRRQNSYIQSILKQANKLINVLPLLDYEKNGHLPAEIEDILASASFRDVQYSLLREDVDMDSDLYNLRMERNRSLAVSALSWLKTNRPDVVIVPNGSMLEFGIIYQLCRYMNIQVMTFEFGEQSERMWLAQNEDVMKQNTEKLWESSCDIELNNQEWREIKEFFSTRQGGGLWKNFSRRWQGAANQGAEKTRNALDLDERPLALLPTNVLGDSLTLGRQIFSGSMTEWLTRTIECFEQRPDWNLVIRVHPGEQLGWGPSVYDILTEAFPHLPPNVFLLAADSKVNTYDLVNIASLGLVFTTTLGMEMVMSGLPVIVSGETHYGNKGFTMDATSWESYYDLLNQALSSVKTVKPTREQIDLAWTYAYRFFFEYPRPFPWHVQHFWDDVEKWPLENVLSESGLDLFDQTFENLTGIPINW